MGFRHAAACGRHRVLRCIIPLTLGMALALLMTASASGIGVDMRISTDSSGNQANLYSVFSSLSADGRYVAFRSYATNLVAGDTNGTHDIFVKDTLTGATTRVSTDSAGNEADNYSDVPSITADGRYVAFMSSASNLVTGDTNSSDDIFVKDRWTGAISRVSTDSAGNEANQSSWFTMGAAISANGRYVVFSSNASNLVAGDTNAAQDIFVKDRQTGVTTRVSTDSAGNEHNGLWASDPAISADGRYVTFRSLATNLVAGDTNAVHDTFIKDRQTGVTTRVSTDSAGNQANGYSDYTSMSANGRYVAFNSNASNLVPGDTNGLDDIFIKDRQTGVTTRVSTTAGGGEANNASSIPSISNDGRYVSFRSFASNLVPGDTNSALDVFFKDTSTGAITRLSTDSLGNEGNSWSDFTAVSADGRYVSFLTTASNLVPGDTNGAWDIVRAPTNIACTVNQPALTLSTTSVYWATMADYVAQLLSIDHAVTNTGVNMAYTVQIVGATATNGVYCATCTPPVTYSLGNFVPGASMPFTLKYFIPIGVGSFSASVSASAQDGCGNGYTYP